MVGANKPNAKRNKTDIILHAPESPSLNSGVNFAPN